jgi:hypothetical protein
MFTYIGVTLFSGAPQRKDILWSVILNGVLALIPAAYVVLLAAKWKKLDLTRKEKIWLIMTGIAGFIMTINIIFWEAYKFW